MFEVTKAPAPTFSPGSVSFGNQALAISNSPQVVTLTNIGRLPLTITSIQTATNSTDFTQTNICPSPLAAFSGCTIDVTFKHTAAGSRGAELQLTDIAGGSPS